MTYSGVLSMLIPKDQVQWREVRYLKEPLETTDEQATWKYKFILPEPLASWDVFSYWEKERIASMEQHLKKGDVLFDIGTEQGWCNLAYAGIVGAENMVLIEPTAIFWGNIKETWYKNFDVHPRATLHALLSNKSTDPFPTGFYGVNGVFPDAAANDLVDRNAYTYIHENLEQVPEIELDAFVRLTKIVPDALTMDVEGAELLILQGAEETLRKHKPKLFISIHPDLGERDYGVKPEQVHDFLSQFGYVGEHLATDHEEHWYFEVA